VGAFLERLRIFDAGNAERYAGELFRECFNAPFPVPREHAGLSIPTPAANWRQYVALYDWPGAGEETVGFCNWIKHGEVYLEGGMCVRKGFYRRLPREHFRECQAAGGIAQLVMEQAARSLTDCTAWFGYCGDAKALAVDLRVGYVETPHRHLIVKWFREVTEEEKRRLIEEIARIGPF
jgi:hypothetical protein